MKVLSQAGSDCQIVAIATGLNREQKNKLQSCIRMLHGQFAEEYSNHGKFTPFLIESYIFN